jgi:hypothetical protein
LDRLREVNSVDKFVLISEYFNDKNETLMIWQNRFAEDLNNYTTDLRMLVKASDF